MRILVLTPYLSYPPDHGGRIRTARVLRALARDHEVVNVTGLAPRDDPRDIRHLEAMGVRVVAAPLDPPAGRLPLALRLRKIGQLARGRSSLVPRYVTRELRQLVRQEAQREVDLVVLDHIWMSGYLDDIGDLPVLFSSHNVESAALLALADVERGPIRRLMTRLEARALAAAEERLVRRAETSVTVSEPDRARLLGFAHQAHIEVVQNGVDPDACPELPRPRFDPPKLLYVGGYDYPPNRDAAFQLARVIMPVVRERNPGAEVWFVGHDPDDRLAPLCSLGWVRTLGRVEELQAVYRDASALVVPLRYGGGTRIKILEAWSLGRPVVATAAAAEGLDALDGMELLLAETPRAMAAAVERLRTEPAFVDGVVRAARERVKTRHRWDDLLGRFREVVLEAAGNARASTASQGHNPPACPPADA